MTCWLRPEGVRDGIWRLVRLLGDGSSDGDAAAGAGCGVGVPAGESDGDNNELISMVKGVGGVGVRRAVCLWIQYFCFYRREVQGLPGIESLVMDGMGGAQTGGAGSTVGCAGDETVRAMGGKRVLPTAWVRRPTV